MCVWFCVGFYYDKPWFVIFCNIQQLYLALASSSLVECNCYHTVRTVIIVPVPYSLCIYKEVSPVLRATFYTNHRRTSNYYL